VLLQIEDFWDEIFALLGCYVAYVGILSTFRTNMFHLKSVKQSVKKGFFLDRCNLKNGTDILSRNIGNQLPTYAAQQPRRAKA
jgi:hypothetical protein